MDPGLEDLGKRRMLRSLGYLASSRLTEGVDEEDESSGDEVLDEDSSGGMLDDEDEATGLSA